MPSILHRFISRFKRDGPQVNIGTTLTAELPDEPLASASRSLQSGDSASGVDLPESIRSPGEDAVPQRTSACPISLGDNYGITLLYSPESITSHGIDIVFVHGLRGNAYKTWLNEKEMLYWPWALLGHDVELRERNIRLFTFGYDADVASFSGGASSNRLTMHSKNLLVDLSAVRTCENIVSQVHY
jgi:hypothetical protein